MIMAMIGKSKQLESKSSMLVIKIKKFVVFLLICLVAMNDKIRSIQTTVLTIENEIKMIKVMSLTPDNNVSPSWITLGQSSISLLCLSNLPLKAVVKQLLSNMMLHRARKSTPSSYNI